MRNHDVDPAAGLRGPLCIADSSSYHFIKHMLNESPLNSPGILLADDNPTVIEAVSRMLTPEFEIVGTVGDGVSLVAAAQRLRPDVMIVDLFMPGLNGMEAARELKKLHIPVVSSF